MSFKLLETVFQKMGMLKEDKEVQALRASSGYYREANQLSCSTSLVQFFEIVQSALLEYRKANPGASEDAFVEKFCAAGTASLQECEDWTPGHAKLRREWGRQKSLMKDDRLARIVEILKSEPSASVEEIDAKLSSSGMSMSIIDKVYILKSRQDALRIRLARLTKAKQE